MTRPPDIPETGRESEMSSGTEIRGQYGNEIAMKVRDLIDALKQCDQEAAVVVGGHVVHGVAPIGGRLRGDTFVRMPENKARIRVVAICHWCELADGRQYLMPIEPGCPAGGNATPGQRLNGA